MNTPVLNDNLRAATEALCNLLAKEDKVVASKAKIGLMLNATCSRQQYVGMVHLTLARITNMLYSLHYL